MDVVCNRGGDNEGGIKCCSKSGAKTIGVSVTDVAKV